MDFRLPLNSGATGDLSGEAAARLRSALAPPLFLR